MGVGESVRIVSGPGFWVVGIEGCLRWGMMSG